MLAFYKKPLFAAFHAVFYLALGFQRQRAVRRKLDIGHGYGG